jgi:hypothetical protein
LGPARLRLLQAYSRFAATDQRGILRFTIDTQSWTGFSEAEIGTPPLAAQDIDYSTGSDAGYDFGERRLEAWLNSVEWPYAPPPEDDAASS